MPCRDFVVPEVRLERRVIAASRKCVRFEMAFLTGLLEFWNRLRGRRDLVEASADETRDGRAASGGNSVARKRRPTSEPEVIELDADEPDDVPPSARNKMPRMDEEREVAIVCEVSPSSVPPQRRKKLVQSPVFSNDSAPADADGDVQVVAEVAVTNGNHVGPSSIFPLRPSPLPTAAAVGRRSLISDPEMSRFRTWNRSVPARQVSPPSLGPAANCRRAAVFPRSAASVRMVNGAGGASAERSAKDVSGVNGDVVEVKRVESFRQFRPDLPWTRRPLDRASGIHGTPADMRRSHGSPPLPRFSTARAQMPVFGRKPVLEVDLTTPKMRGTENGLVPSLQTSPPVHKVPHVERQSMAGVSFADFSRMLAQKEEQQRRERDRKIQLTQASLRATEDEEAELQRRLADSFQLRLKVSEVVLEEEEEVAEEEEGGLDAEFQLAPLSPDAENEVKKALLPVPKDQLLSEKFNIPIRRKDMVTLAPGAWLNDEVINFYLNMIVERGSSEGAGGGGGGRYPSVYAHPTFFYTTLASRGHAGVKRWTRRVDIFAKDLLLIPVHLQVHWTIVVVDMKEKRVEFLDSMGSQRWDIVGKVMDYLKDEMKDKKGQELDVSEWKKEIPKVPQQKNGWDCGMFACKFGDYRARRAKFDFSQAEMPYFRRRMVWEILHKAFYRPS